MKTLLPGAWGSLVGSSLAGVRGVLLALPLMALLPGCPIWGDGSGRRAACDDDRDCPGMMSCVAGACVPTPECTVDADCGAGRLCDATGMCRDRMTCRTHGDCNPGDVCRAGLCEPGTTCMSDAECPSGEWCDWRNTCVPRSGCRSHADCGTSELCLENACVPQPQACVTSRDCAAGYVCLNNECAPGCSTAASCSPGDTCEGGFCRSAAPECTTSAGCGAGEHCVHQRCLPDCMARPTSCGAEAECATDGFCHPRWQPQDFCRTDADCTPGRSVCRGGVCRTPCPTMMDSQCRAIDSELPLCREDLTYMEFFCQSDATPMIECTTQAICGAGRDCLDGVCRNR